MSADSDIATFRPTNHLDNSTATEMKEEKTIQSPGNLMRTIPLEDACYQSKPEKAWFYDAGYREAIMKSTPHPGYHMLLRMLTHLQQPYFVMTTNIDRYFAKAGFPEDLIFETHGSVDALQCSKIGMSKISVSFFLSLILFTSSQVPTAVKGCGYGQRRLLCQFWTDKM